MAQILVVLSLLLALTGGQSGTVRLAAGPTSVGAEHIVDGDGRPLFLVGANYEGPADRAWRMWEDGLFDAALIGRDFDRAVAANLSVLRVFVQRPLADDIRAGRWSKLDRVLDLAERRGLKLILTFADYPELDLTRLARIDAAVGARYRGRPTIFAYDLKNEPRFWDLALSQYPGTVPPLQDLALVQTLGEAVSRADIAQYCGTEQGQRDIPRRLDDDQAHVYANVLAAYRLFLEDGQAWVRANSSTIVRYIAAPESAAWDPLIVALDVTLAAWIEPRLWALRSADPERPVTVGHVDAVLASSPANTWLDYRTLHQYPTASSEGIVHGMALFDDVRAAVPGKALVLGEFGFSSAAADEDQTAALELQMARAACDHGGAGVLKWMLNDFPSGSNPRENAFGMFRGDGSAKPVVDAFQGLGDLRPIARPFAPTGPRASDYDLCGGHFFTQTNGYPLGMDPSGFAVADDQGIAFWDAFQQLGGVPALGYPIGRRFLLDGVVVQPMQKAVFRWRPSDQRVEVIDRAAWARAGHRIPPEATVPERRP